MSEGFIKLIRSQATIELVKRPKELALMTLIALRVKRENGFSIHNLEIGESFIGDHKNCGLSRQEYRTAISNLQKWGLITSRPTNKGTIVKIIKSDVFDTNTQLANHQTPKNQPSNPQKSTTNKKKEERIKNKKEYCPNSIEIGLSNLLFSLINQKNANHKKPDLQKWAVHVDRMITFDKRHPDQIRDVIEWCQADEFWFKNILSTEKLRQKFDQLYLSMGKTKGGDSDKMELARYILECDGDEACRCFCRDNNLNFERVRP